LLIKGAYLLPKHDSTAELSSESEKVRKLRNRFQNNWKLIVIQRWAKFKNLEEVTYL